MIRYDSYKDSGVEWIGEIPSGWRKSPIKYYYNYKKGSRGQELTKTYIQDNLGEYPVYSGQTENEGVLGRISEYEFDFPEGVIFTTTVGVKMMSTKVLRDKFSLSQNCLIMIPKKEVNSDFVNYFISVDWVFRKLQFPKILQPSLRMEDIDQYFFYCPTISEQQEIVSFLDTKTSLIDSLIEKTQRKIELLKEKRTSLINEVVTKGLNPNVEMKDSGVEWIGEIPSHWVKTNVRMLIGKGFLEIQDGNHGEIHPKSEDYIDDGIPFVMSNNLRDGIVDYESCKKLDKDLTDKLRIGFSKTGDVLLTHKGTIGRVSIVSEMDYPYIMLTPQVTYYRCLDNSISNRHLYYQFQSDFFQKEMDLLSSDGSTRKFIGIVDQRNLPLLIIPINEQQQIVEYLDEQTQLIDNTISIQEKRIELLKEYRQSLISEVVTGKRKVV